MRRRSRRAARKGGCRGPAAPFRHDVLLDVRPGSPQRQQTIMRRSPEHNSQPGRAKPCRFGVRFSSTRRRKSRRSRGVIGPEQRCSARGQPDDKIWFSDPRFGGDSSGTRCSNRAGVRALELTASGERRRSEVLRANTRAALAAEGLVGPAQAEWVDRVRDDPRITAARQAIERGRPTEASERVGLSLLWLIRDMPKAWWCREILNLPSLPPAAELRAPSRGCAVAHAGELAAHRPTRVRAAHGIWDAVVRAQICPRASNTRWQPEGGPRLVCSLSKGSGRWRFRGGGNALSDGVGRACDHDAGQAERLLTRRCPCFDAGPWFLTWRCMSRHGRGAARNADEAIAGRRKARLHQDPRTATRPHTRWSPVAAAVVKGDDVGGAFGARDAVSSAQAPRLFKLVHDSGLQAERRCAPPGPIAGPV
jgi:hypothetical protein